ncbi:hypothetical protein E5A73_17095 [Sphingomonas gei]|uniref:Uncharacterized protein n=1 Tax=Sphingomonas gei TaxID=1395960 RepID=A0A4S1X2J0_9SPHN|nr:hypothetical protein [Sphingomonas gei]TGX50139.1 hypothetical protein E5A73_17095 [Sphingomonas gei]
MAAPDLKDPAYRRELGGVALRMRRWGIGISLGGALLVLACRRGFGVPLWVGAGVLGLGILVLIAAISTRATYHRLRTRG